MPAPDEPLLTTPPPLTHALSFDVEDWFHLVEIDAVDDPGGWPSLPSLVVERTTRILELLSEHQTRATFFVLGWVAERYPQLVTAIAQRGHEIGSHSFWHRRVYELDAASFREDIERSLRAIEACTSQPVLGFRAPSFSIVPGTEWAFDVLRELGFQYDSSLFPARRAHGGFPCPRGPHLLKTPGGGTLRELPISVAGFGALKLCYSGGGYFRLLPGALIEYGLRQEAASGRPTVVYLHPRDFGHFPFRISMPLYRRFKCSVGVASTERKLRRLLSRHRFDSCSRVLEERLAAN